jgi:hypothetical protein
MEPYTPVAIHLTEEELAEMQDQIDRGELPPDAIEQHFQAEARNVYGHDAKQRADGSYIEQGIGSKGHETANHYAALAKAEREGFESPGSYKAALEEIWKRDPKRAKALNLPPPPSRPEPRGSLT